MYDVIGDIHGQRDALERLLVKMGYREERGTWRHPERLAVFVGDLVDRGHDVPGTVDLVRGMHEAGAAKVVMGNHEWNLLAWHETHPETGEPLRSHGPRKAKQIRETMVQYARVGGLESALDWFRTMPTSLDLDGLRVVHATWDQTHITRLDALRGATGRFDTQDFVAMARPGTPHGDAVEIVLKGREGRMPGGRPAIDQDGGHRSRVRLRWFDDPAGRRWPEYVLQDDVTVPDEPLPPEVGIEATPWPADAPPVIFGHYSIPMPEPRVLRDNVACVDHGAGRGWQLAAYRWDGERTLTDDRFVRVDVEA